MWVAVMEHPICSWDWRSINLFVEQSWTPTQQSTWRKTSPRNLQLLLVTPQRAAVSSVSVNKQFALWTAETSCVNKTGFELWHAAVSMKTEEGSIWLRPRACGQRGVMVALQHQLLMENICFLPCPLERFSWEIGPWCYHSEPGHSSWAFWDNIWICWEIIKNSTNDIFDGIKGTWEKNVKAYFILSLKISSVR